MRVGSLFSGYGGLELAIAELWPDHDLVWVCENDVNASKVLSFRFPEVSNLGDITQVDWSHVAALYGPIEVLVGGFPCQDVSTAGTRAGLRGDTQAAKE